MKVGFDLDGVVIDSETTFRTYEEIFSIEDLNNKPLIDIEEPKYQQRYNWTEEEQHRFNQKYLYQGALDSNIMAGFLPIYHRLKEMNIEMVVITARGLFIDEMKDEAMQLLNNNNIVFDNYYWYITNKVEICQKENIDIMIDDDYRIIQQLSDAKIKTLYFRDTNMKKLQESEFIHEVNNWGEVYRYFTEIGIKLINT